ncbi:Chemotaxis protein methyltransferase CheR [Desulfurella amilsii]|uniref:protein-glutamate O-methyltransferase n=1 Tax=Desulfurella amilsii TaxID=1562698 RepID=A0A1X4Y029_9BACT|nr:protein-glutamate O-methyltransferase CheR [Desulfurella amilsii]OSS43124.1 Chemotaxis protein methyltransferase CheR [Desulfurella amilsii]
MPEMDSEIFENLRNFIYEKSGIFFEVSKKYLLENKLSKRIQELKLRDYEDYLRFLQNRKDELCNLFDAITINETYLFRHAQQIEVFLIVANELLKQKPMLNIWSAACSSGEEPYTLVIALMEKYGQQIPARILASDISQEVLEKAKNGIYNEYAVKELTSAIKQKYFDIEKNTYKIKDFVKSKVVLRQLNLIDNEDLSSVGKMDIIFLRNVLIYFDNKSRQKVIDKIHNDILNKNGYLFLGATESISRLNTKLKLVHFKQALAYKKED